ncbi:MAG: hypothetical protein NTY15_19145 [Planctomycetota bacterium]|nr:hypothetical protein [Planctomycetota bacterium]
MSVAIYYLCTYFPLACITKTIAERATIAAAHGSMIQHGILLAIETAALHVRMLVYHGYLSSPFAGVSIPKVWAPIAAAHIA